MVHIRGDGVVRVLLLGVRPTESACLYVYLLVVMARNPGPSPFVGQDLLHWAPLKPSHFVLTDSESRAPVWEQRRGLHLLPLPSLLGTRAAKRGTL